MNKISFSVFFISCLLLSACAKEVAVYDKSPTNPSANAPAPVSGGYPMYPREAALRGIEGWVKVQFTISGDGSVKDAVVLDANPEGVFDEFARDAVLKWKFKPQVVNGVAVDTPNQVTIVDFKIEK